MARRDAGSGSFRDYDYQLVARSRRVVITLAGSDPYQGELRAIAESGETEIETAVSPRTIEQERVDAEIPVRLFVGRRVTGVVGTVPRGLESVVDENLRRVGDETGRQRIPVRIVRRRGAYRVQLLMGALR